MPEYHISDIKKFKSCRQVWDYSSPLRMNLAPKKTPLHFVLGKGVHYACSALYETGEKPCEAYERYIAYYKEKEGHLWGPKTLDTIRLGHAMCETYYSWVTGSDAPDALWKVIATEIRFGPVKLPIPGTSKFSSKYALTGRFDQVIENKLTGALWIREFKTSARAPAMNWLDNDDQLTAYTWSIQKILGKPIEGVQYRFLMKSAPVKPELVQKDTRLSRAIHSSLKTTYDLYKQAIEENHFNPVDYADILGELEGLGWGEYIIEYPSVRSQEALRVAAENLFLTVWDMDHNPTIYPSPDWIRCAWCSHLEPCIALREGREDLSQQLLEAEFAVQVREKTEDIDLFARIDVDGLEQEVIEYDEG